MRFHPPRQHRPGMTSVLAMLYLVLFASLAVGFYAATNTAVQVSTNERHGRQAMLSTESGLEFMRHILGNVEIPPGATADQVWTQFCQQVAAQLNGPTNNGTPNFGNIKVYPPAAGVTTWTLPTLKLPGGGTCTVTMVPNDGNTTTMDVTVLGLEPDLRPDKTQGSDPNHRKIKVTFVKGPRASEIFNYGVASRSSISMGGNAKITGTTGALNRGSVLSATTNAVPLTMTGSPKISGDFSYTNPAGAPVFGNGSIAGYSSSSDQFANHVHPGVAPPEFPAVDSSPFEKYVPAPSATGASVITSNSGLSTRHNFVNIRIKAGVNPTFNTATIQGVMFIETPNIVTFGGQTTIQGVVVVQNNPTGTPASGPNDNTPNANALVFNGNVSHTGVEVPLDKGGLDPTDPRFAGLANLSGSFLLAPQFLLYMRGNSNQVGGTIVASRIDLGGTAGANVKGSVINLDDTSVNMTGTSDIVISPTGSDKPPAGLTFGSHFTPNPSTYLELQ